MDLEKIFTLLCGYRQRGKPIINEVQLEKFGNEDFKKFVAHVCKLKHVQSAIENGRLEMEPGLSHVIYHKMKQGLKYLLWEKKDVMLKWFLLTTKKKSLTTLATEVPSNASVLQSFSLFVPKAKSPMLDVQFIMTFCDDEEEYTIQLNETAIYKSIYSDEEVYSSLGKEVCLLVDIVLAKGGPESVVESYYSVMKSQQHMMVVKTTRICP